MTTGIDLIALDVDGTVLTPLHEVTPAVRESVAAARALGTRVVLASSRGPRGLIPVQRALDLTHEWFIAFQGALVARWVDIDGELESLVDLRITPQAAGTVIRTAVAAGLTASWYDGLAWTAPVLDAAIRHAAEVTGEVPTIEPAWAATSVSPHKILLIAGDLGLLPALRGVHDRLPPGVVGAHSHENYLEVTASGATKGEGLAAVAGEFGVPMAASAAIGDGANDIAMLRVAGVSVAMGQAPAEVRDVARWTTRTNSEDGVAWALRRIIGERQGDRP